VYYQLALLNPGKLEVYIWDLNVNLPRPDLECTAHDRPEI
jgi:hypothetical protein